MRRRRNKRHNGCRGKARYATFGEAKSDQPAQQPYLCPSCKCWHLTSAVESRI